jgi:NAD(P)-dependent dehydrogenase (short-subunit alcohol dehydrogenase family)
MYPFADRAALCHHHAVELDGASVIVTGGASGLGEATVRRLTKRDAQVTIADIDDTRAKQIVDELGPRVDSVHTDVTSEADVQNVVADAAARGPLRVVVNCAGHGLARRLVARDGTPHDLEGFVWVVQLCLVGTFNVMRLAAAEMAKTAPDGDGQRGVIVNTASIAAFEGQIGQTAYAAAKGGVVGLTMPAARDLAAIGVRVNTIAPGTFATPPMATMPKESVDAFVAMQPFPKRLGNPDEFAMLVEQIVDNPMLNGEVIRLDGAVRFPPR